MLTCKAKRIVNFSKLHKNYSVSLLLLEKLLLIYCQECMDQLGNLDLFVPSLLLANFSLQVLWFSCLMNYYKRDMVLDLEFHYLLLPIFVKASFGSLSLPLQFVPIKELNLKVASLLSSTSCLLNLINSMVFNKHFTDKTLQI